MQRYILKTTLICGIALLLTGVSINSLYAAEDAIETSINLEENVSGTYYVNAEHGLKMRNAPSTDADVITLLPYKAEVSVTSAATDKWYKIEYSNQSGYVAADYITKSSASNENAKAEDTSITETQESTLLSETGFDDTTDTFGVTPVITALIAAIIIMTILAMYTAYSFLKKGNDNYYDEEYDDEEYDDEYDSNEEYSKDNRAYDEEYDDEDDEH